MVAACAVRQPGETILAGRNRVDVLLQMLAGVDGWVVYALLALLVFGESAGVVALFLPGELALMAAGAVAARGHVSLPAVLAIAVVGAVAGHAAGYEFGRRYGLSMLRWPLLRRYANAVGGAAALVARYGGAAVFLGRWMNIGRIVVPLLVGAGRMRYRTFMLYNVVGGTAWALTFVLLGAAAGASLGAAERVAGRASWWLTGAIAVGLAGVWVWRRSHGHRNEIAAHRDVGRGEQRCTVKVVNSSVPGRDA